MASRCTAGSIAAVNRNRRLAWAAVGGRMTHHNASAQVFPHDDGGSRIVWIADLLPDDLKGAIGAMIDQGGAAMKETLDRLADA
jgi:hypothetical protein